MPIGERTHRLFLLFLLSNIIVAGFYSYGSFLKIYWRYESTKYQISMEQSKLDQFLVAFVIIFEMEPMTLSAFVVLAVITVVLLIFLSQQCFYISRNILQIEQEKYEYLIQIRKEEKINKPVLNYYDKGFIENWKSFLFPPKVPLHEPMSYHKKGE